MKWPPNMRNVGHIDIHHPIILRADIWKPLKMSNSRKWLGMFWFNHLIEYFIAD